VDWQAWIAIAVTLSVVAALAANLAAPDLVLVGGLTVLLALGVIDPKQGLAGFSNEGVAAVAVLFVVAAGLRETGALDLVARRWLGRPRSIAGAQLRLMLPVAAVSGFVNNTPVVAVMVPVVLDWARRAGLSASKLLMPLSYATILGGTVTLIGTSTNLLVSGLASEQGVAVGLFEIAWVGVPVAVIGIAYVLLLSRWLLPDRGEREPALSNPREYAVAMHVETGSPIVGQSIEAAGLRHLPGLFLAEIERGGEPMPAVAPGTRIAAEDRLLFVGVVESVVDLRRIRGLVPAGDQVEKLAEPRTLRRLVEAVVGAASPLSGRSVRESAFRTEYGAAIIAVHRHGERIGGRIGDIVLRAGDTLLLETRPTFAREHRNDPTFALVAEVAGSEPPRHERAWIAASLLLAMVLGHALFGVNLVTAALLAAGALVASRCLTGPEAVRALDLRVIIAIAASFGIGESLHQTGAARSVAEGLLGGISQFGPIGILAGIYLTTMVLTELITNNAAAVLMYPIAAATAEAAGMELRPFLFILMMAASASFSTPIGYQTNLMVYGPGGYRFLDFLRFGVPLQLLLGAVTVAIVSVKWL
jgi:di/tricarboxylate transporter